MAEKRAFEYRVLQFVPNPVQGVAVNVGILLMEVGEGGAGFVDLQLTEDWGLASKLHPDFDAEVLSQFAATMKGLLTSGEMDASKGGEAVSRRAWALSIADEWFSNAIQLSSSHAVMTDDPAAEMKRLVKMYCSLPTQHRREVLEVGRSGILRRMRSEFEQAGVWEQMSREIRIQTYTRQGDPLKIDCGYRYPREYMPGLSRNDQKFRMFHAVSLKKDVNAAKVLAFTFGDFRVGLEKEVKATAELTAIVEDGIDRREEESGSPWRRWRNTGSWSRMRAGCRSLQSARGEN